MKIKKTPLADFSHSCSFEIITVILVVQSTLVIVESSGMLFIVRNSKSP